MRLATPVGGEVWSGHRRIQWQTLTPAADVARVRAEVRVAESGEPVASMAAEGNPGELAWDTSEISNGRYCVRLSAFDADGALVGEDMGDPFTVRNRGKLVTRRRVVAAVPIAALGLLWWHPWRPRAVSAGDVEADPDAYLGTTARVRFHVVSSRATDEVIFLNASTDAYDKDFTATIFPEDLAAFRDAGIDDPIAHYYGKTVEVWGTVEWFHGPEIVLKSPEQIRVVGWWEVW